VTAYITEQYITESLGNHFARWCNIKQRFFYEGTRFVRKAAPVVVTTKAPDTVWTVQEPVIDIPPQIMMQILVAVAEYLDISIADIKSESRSKQLVYARHLFCYLCKKHTDKSLPEIGRRIGNRDHSTVLHAVRKMTTIVNSGNYRTNRHISEIEAKLDLTSID
jgi:chromosomal replication initiation ATPase DnaA